MENEIFDPNNFLHPTYVVEIRHNPTGVVRFISTGLAWYDHSMYFWTEGNFSCDCNRAIVFNNMKSAGVDHRCGYRDFTAIRAIFPDGTEERIDEETNA